MMERPFDGQCAVVTGATSGVGQAIARDLAMHGAHVALVGRRTEALSALASEIQASEGTAGVYPTDLTDDAAVERLSSSVIQDLASIDILVHSAGIFALGDMEHVSIRDLDAQYRVNVRGPFLLTQKLLGGLRRSEGQIVFVNSTAGKIARAGVGPYAASKHALRAVADSLREEVNGEGIRVLSIFLGRTNTPMQEEVHRLEGRLFDPDVLIQPDDIAQLTRQLLLLPRSAEVTEVSIRPMRKG